MVFEKVTNIIAEVTGAEGKSITGELNLKEDIGCDDLDIVEIVLSLEDEFDIVIADDSEQFQTVDDVVNYIKEAVE